MQALDRTRPGLPSQSGRAQTLTHDYKRHGTTTLFAALNVLDGQVIGQCQQRHTHAEWLKFLRQIDRETPKDKTLHLIADNYVTPDGAQDGLTLPAEVLQRADRVAVYPYSWPMADRSRATLMATQTLPTFFLSHGGGPWPWMKGPMRDAHDRLAIALRELPQRVGTKPKAILVVSAHWEEPEFTLMTHPNPPMVYDYTGFPAHTYRVRYAAPGAPELAEKVRRLLDDAQIPVRIDSARGYDHGAYVPLSVSYPSADIPVTQLSLKAGLDPSGHLAAGRALAALRDDGVLLVGSGSSSHNQSLIGRPEAREPMAAFDAWLQLTLTAASPEDRLTGLRSWERAPGARVAHPREEHLLPLMVVAGAARGDAGTCCHHEELFLGTGDLSNFMFGRSCASASLAASDRSGLSR